LHGDRALGHLHGTGNSTSNPSGYNVATYPP
jgi:hypothetical protein